MRWVRGDSSHGQQCLDGRGTWPRGQEPGDGWRHAVVGFCRRQDAGARVRASGRRGVSLGRRGGCWARAKRCGSKGAARRQAGPPVRLGRKRGGGPRMRKTNPFSFIFSRNF